MNFGAYPMVNGQSRLQRRFYDETAPLAAARAAIGQALDADEALKLGLVTSAPDDIDWDDEVRIAIEERASLSPDALTGMEANLRFGVQGNDGDARLRPPLRMAELDLHPTQRRRRKGRAEGVRQGRQGAVRLERV